MLCRRDRFTSLSFAFTFNQNKRELHRYGDAKTPQSPVPRYKGIDPLQELAHLKAEVKTEVKAEVKADVQAEPQSAA